MLYFDNLSPDSGDAYLADGITEELIVHLGQIDRLSVKSRNAVQRFRGKAGEDPAVLGRWLGVGHLVSGSVRRAGARLRVTVELVRAATGVRVWGDALDRTNADILSIEEDIAREVATAIAGRLLPVERASLAARPTQNRDAYEHFLRGNYDLAQRTQPAAARAITEYEAAVRLDPGFTRALARVGVSYALFLAWSWEYPGVPPESVSARGLSIVNRALQQDSTAGDAWMARGMLLQFRVPASFDGVREAFRRSVSLDPRNAEAHHQYAWALTLLGEDSAAVDENRRALAIEPERAITLFQLAWLHFAARRYEEARRWYDSALVVDPGAPYVYTYRARLRLQVGDTAGARADAETGMRLGELTDGSAALVLIDMHEGDTLAARRHAEPVLREVAAVDRLSWGYHWAAAAMTLVALGNEERALDLLERVWPQETFLWFVLKSPEFDSLRSHHRFQTLVEESRPPGVPK